MTGGASVASATRLHTRRSSRLVLNGSRSARQGPDGSPPGVVVVNSSMASAIHRKADRCQLPPLTSMAAVERTPSSKIPTLCLVKPEPAWADFLGPRWDSPIRGLLLQPAATGRLDG